MQKTITAVNRATMTELRNAVNEALKQVAETYGLESLFLGSITMDTDKFTGKLDGRLKAENSPAVLAKQINNSRLLGYDRNIIGEAFKVQGKTFTVKSIELGRPKFPISADCEEDGKSYKFPAKKRIMFENKEINFDISKNLFAH